MYAIQKFVLEKMKENDLKKTELVKRAGYTNISKGCRRFDSFINDNDYSRMFMDNLHIALDVPKEEVEEKFRETQIEIQREIEEENNRRIDFERRSFVPHLFCHTERKKPGSIWLCAMLRSDTLKTRNLPLYFNTLPVEEQRSAVKELIAEIMERHDGQIPAFGKIICFTVKKIYDDIEDEREVYDINGDLIPNPPAKYREINTGRASLALNGKHLMKLTSKLEASDVFMVKKNQNIRNLNYSSFMTALKMNGGFTLPEDRTYFSSDGELLGNYSCKNVCNRGGIIVFPLDMGYMDVRNEFLSRDDNNYIYDSEYKKKLPGIIMDFFTEQETWFPEIIRESIIYSTGHFFRGSYTDLTGFKVFNNDSFAIEISGLDSEWLLDFAVFLMKKYKESVLMIKDLNTGKTFLTDNLDNIEIE